MSSSSELRESSNGQRNVGHSETHLQEMAGEGGGPPPPVPPESMDQSGGGGGSDACYDLKQAASTVYRTHPYFLPYDFRQTTDVDVTLTAQLSMDRSSHITYVFCLLFAHKKSLMCLEGKYSLVPIRRHVPSNRHASRH